MLFRWSTLTANGLLLFFDWRLAVNIDYVFRREDMKRTTVTYKQAVITYRSLVAIFLILILTATMLEWMKLDAIIWGLLFSIFLVYFFFINRCANCGRRLGRTSPIARKRREHWVSFGSCPCCGHRTSPDDVLWLLLPRDIKRRRKADAMEKRRNMVRHRRI